MPKMRRALAGTKIIAGLIGGLSTLIACLLAAAWLKTISGFPAPAPVIGILLLVLVLVGLKFTLKLAGRDFVPTGLHKVATFLLRHMALFFIPVLVLLLDQTALLHQYGLILLLIIVPGTALALPLTALLFLRLMKKQNA